MFSLRRKHRRHKDGHCCRGTMSCATEKGVPENCITLEQAPVNKKLTVRANSDIKTIEMGLYPGSILTLIHSEAKGHNIIVKIHDQRYVIPRKIAKQIYVRI